MTMKDGYYLSIYAHVDEIGACYKLLARHDQNMALWIKQGKRVELLRYWEFERYSGLKHHGLSFFNTEHAWEIISKLLGSVNILPEQLNAVWGTPGLSSENDIWMKSEKGFNSHSLSHLYAAMLFDTHQFQCGTTLALALDGGPDTQIDNPDNKMPLYAGAVAINGDIEVFPISSPGGLWACLSYLTKMEEGSLMALGSASSSCLRIPVAQAPEVRCLSDFTSAWDWVEHLLQLTKSFRLSDRAFSGFDPLFTEDENRLSMAVKVVQRESMRQVRNTVDRILKKYALTPSKTRLALTGGFALNCPTNTYLMRKFDFADFQTPPCVNDGGMSLGYGLRAFLHYGGRFEFVKPMAGMGMINRSSYASSPDEDYIELALLDLDEGPIAWVEGGAEMGPRALGHRSLLADPRSRAMRARLNQAKQRQWWRPVAPVILAECLGDWFDGGWESPFMLHVMDLKPERICQVPGIAHIDGSARVQTLTFDEAPLLYKLLCAFYERTGIPMLCNTSLNDKGEPIVNTYEEAIAFAQRRGIAVCYFDGQRRVVPPNQFGADKFPPPRTMAKHFAPSQFMCDKIKNELNPHGLTRKELSFWLNSPRLKRLDIKDKSKAEFVRRHCQIIEKQFAGRPLPVELLLQRQEGVIDSGILQ